MTLLKLVLSRRRPLSPLLWLEGAVSLLTCSTLWHSDKANTGQLKKDGEELVWRTSLQCAGTNSYWQMAKDDSCPLWIIVASVEADVRNTRWKSSEPVVEAVGRLLISRLENTRTCCQTRMRCMKMSILVINASFPETVCEQFRTTLTHLEWCGDFIRNPGGFCVCCKVTNVYAQ